jgi:hypothetical protein
VSVTVTVTGTVLPWCAQCTEGRTGNCKRTTAAKWHRQHSACDELLMLVSVDTDRDVDGQVRDDSCLCRGGWPVHGHSRPLSVQIR